MIEIYKGALPEMLILETVSKHTLFRSISDALDEYAVTLKNADLFTLMHQELKGCILPI